ncbi:hypothetical protein [Methylobacterium nigriterrae]|uniref:hypothetical protein n=1 Tax=Methylobacterium nigriterrae TaxID=3127512 RepID=UPI0030139019
MADLRSRSQRDGVDGIQSRSASKRAIIVKLIRLLMFLGIFLTAIIAYLRTK